MDKRDELIQNLDNRIAWISDEINTVQNRIEYIEEELQRFRESFVSDLLAEIADRFKRFVDNKELTGMTNEEFDYELHQLLFN